MDAMAYLFGRRREVYIPTDILDQVSERQGEVSRVSAYIHEHYYYYHHHHHHHHYYYYYYSANQHMTLNSCASFAPSLMPQVPSALRLPRNVLEPVV
jgi:hypothetical protein